MRRVLAAVLMAASAATARADDPKPHAAGWFKQGASLLFFDPAGNLEQELPLETSEEQSGARVAARETLGGASPNARFGWIFDRTITWNLDRSRMLGSRRLLRLFGTEGKELWSSSEADIPESGDPIIFSQDSEILMLARHNDEGWTASVRGFVGNTILEVGPVPRLQLMALTPSGRYAMVRWLVPDESATHTFLEIPSKTRQDVPSSELYLGLARITDDGKVYSGKKFVFDFAGVSSSTATVPASPPPTGPDRP